MVSSKRILNPCHLDRAPALPLPCPCPAFAPAPDLVLPPALSAVNLKEKHALLPASSTSFSSAG